MTMREPATGGQSAVLQVVILRDGLLVGTEVFVPGSYTLGSGATAEVHLEDASVDPLHAVLYFQNGRAAIQDRSSRTGVYVNGHRVQTCEVRSQDEVLCGPFVLKTRVVMKHAAPATTKAPPEVEALLSAAPPAPAPPPPSVRPVVPPVVAAATQPRAAPRHRPPIVPLTETTEPEMSAPAASMAGAPRTVPSARRKAALAAAPVYEPLPPPVPDATADGRTSDVIEVDAEMIDDGSEEVTSADRPNLFVEAFASTLVSNKPPGDVGVPPITQSKPTARPGVAAAQSTSNTRARGRPHLNIELYWGGVRHEARSFKKLSPKKPLVAAARDTAAMPLWGFTLPAEEFELATSAGKGFEVFIPPNATVELQAEGSNTFVPFTPIAPPGGPKHRSLTLTSGMAARLCEGEMSLLVYAAPRAERPWGNPLRAVPWLMVVVLMVFGAGFGAFLHYLPQRPEGPDFSASGLPSVAVKLIAPEPQKKAAAKKQLEKIKARAKKAKQLAKKASDKVLENVAEKKAHKKTPVASRPVVQSKALQALARLSAAGPATNDVLAAADTAGAGPGSKKSNFKLAGLVGKDPVANAGLGNFGLGAGGKGGTATRGLEVLNGSGGGGIGALGASGFGKSRNVGGTVTRASPRQIGAKGSIDREAVAKVINSHFQEVRGCYERALLKEPGLSGKAVLEWTISTRGRVSSTRTKSSTLRNAEVEACILRAIKTWRFPPARGGSVIITYPFLFNSVGY